jgi:hypothetical protein
MMGVSIGNKEVLSAGFERAITALLRQPAL